MPTGGTGDGMPLANPVQARSIAAEPRWGRRKVRGPPLVPDAALGLLGAFLGKPAVLSSPESTQRAAATGLKTR